MRKPRDQVIQLGRGGPPIIPVSELPSEPAMPPARLSPPAPIRVDAEQLTTALRPVVDALERLTEACTRSAVALERLHELEVRRRTQR